MFMSLVEVSGVEGFKPLVKKPIFIVRFHEPSAISQASAAKCTAS
jgi:hypothetical protein